MLIPFQTAASAACSCGRYLGLSMLFVILFSGPAETAVTLAWDPNPENDIAGYIISYGVSSRQYTTSIDVGNTTTWVFSQPDTTKVYFLAVQAYNTAGLQSPYSNEVSTTPVVQPLTATSLISNAPAQPCVGTPITFAAAATGGAAPYSYKWWVFDGSTSTIGQNWSTSNTFVWTPTRPKPSYSVSVWVRSASSTADAFENPGATLSMTVSVVGAGATVANSEQSPQRETVVSNVNNENRGTLESTRQIAPAPASTGTHSSNVPPPVSISAPRAGVTARTQNREPTSQSRPRADAAQAPRPAPVVIIFANAAPPVRNGAPDAGSNRGETRFDGERSTDVADRTDVGGYEILPTYEPNSPSAPALTVGGNRTSSIESITRRSESSSRDRVRRVRRDLRQGADSAVQDPSPLPGPAPTVTRVVPSSGSVKGGTTVTITGANFVPGATVSFGGVAAATTVLVASSTSIVATTPSHVGGVVGVVVTNPDQQSGGRADGFRFIAPAGTLK